MAKPKKAAAKKAAAKKAAPKKAAAKKPAPKKPAPKKAAAKKPAARKPAPKKAAAKSAKPAKPKAVVSRAAAPAIKMPRTVAFKDVKVGDALPELPIPITTALVVGGALASRDFTPVHHDKSVAQSQGMQDVFMNILTTNGLVGRYASDWAGPNAIVKYVSIKLGAPNFPGDTMKMSGTVKDKNDAEKTVELDIVGRNSWGAHVTGTVRVALP